MTGQPARTREIDGGAMSPFVQSLPEPEHPDLFLLSRAAALDPGKIHRAAVVTTAGAAFLSREPDDYRLVREIVDFLVAHRIGVVACGDPQGQFLFPVSLLRKAAWEARILFVLGSEYCTSRRCPRCRTHHQSEKQIYRCPSCGLALDRNIVGALNIFQHVFGRKSRLPELEGS